MTDSYVRNVRLVGWLSILAFAAYVASFAVAFTEGGDTMVLLPVFGAGAMAMIWIVTIYALAQLRHQSVVTTVHVFLVGGLLVAGLGATAGVLIGLNLAIGVGTVTVQAHAPTMLFYLFLVASAIVDWVIFGESAGRFTRMGLAQAVALVVGAIIPPVAFLFGLEMLAPLMLVMLGVFLLLFLVRVGWRALYTNPLTYGEEAWTFFGSLWLIVLVVAFPAEIALQPDPPEWLLPVLAHAGFVGMVTNLLFGVLTIRTHERPSIHPWVGPATMWLINLGVVIFFALRIGADSRLGALVMGVGVLVGLGSFTVRLLKSDARLRSGGDV